MIKIKRITALILSLTLVFILFSCSDKKETKIKETEKTQEITYPELTEEYVQGKWSARVYADDLLASSGSNLESILNSNISSYGITIDDLGIEIKDSLILKYVINFEGNKVTQTIEHNETNDYFDYLNNFYKAVGEYISDPEIFASLYYENGMDGLEEAAGNADMTVEEFLEDEIEYVSNTMERTLEEINQQFPEATFTIDDNTLTVSSEVDSVTYNYSSGTLVTDSNGLALAFIKE
ncbi:MAG: hypothetical protein IKU52_03130 [Clostridia bacterium]|nr:hypothetical protein [Clostridia bacterium]